MKGADEGRALFNNELQPIDARGDGDSWCYREADIRRVAGEVIELGKSGLMAVRIVDDFHVAFAVFRWAQGPCTPDDGLGVLYERIFDGSGPSGGLRECRHTYWGEPNNSGYIFYPHKETIVRALIELERWFDMS